MGEGRTDERGAALTRQQLMAAAARAFARRGFHGASVQRIAAEAGVNASLINYHFGGKLGLYRACLGRFGEARLAALGSWAGPPATAADLRARLELLIGELLDQHLREPEIVTILLRDVDEAEELWGPELEQQLFAFTTGFGRIFYEAQAQGLLRPQIDPLTAAALIYLAFSGLVQVAGHVERVSGLSLKGDAVRRDIIQKTLEIVFNGVMRRDNQEEAV